MNRYLVAAAALAVIVGLVHSVLGERMVFSRMRLNRLVPTNGGSILDQRHVRILWASWHVLTVFGWAFAGLLVLLASQTSPSSWRDSLLAVIATAMLGGAALVLYATSGRHPGWVGLLGVSLLTWLGSGH